MSARVIALCVSERKGTKKHPVPTAVFLPDFGIGGDAHAGKWHRQVSLLANESVDTMRAMMPTLAPGDFAENVLTEGVDLKHLPVGTRLTLGEVELEITQIGKECHADCEIRRITGRCVMPTDGVFARVLSGGVVSVGDPIMILN